MMVHTINVAFSEELWVFLPPRLSSSDLKESVGKKASQEEVTLR